MEIFKPERIQYDVELSEEEFNCINAAVDILENLAHVMFSKECRYIHTGGEDMTYYISEIDDVIERLREYSTIDFISNK